MKPNFTHRFAAVPIGLAFLIVCAAAIAGCGHSAPKSAVRQGAMNPVERQAMRRDMIGPAAH
ncbi:hypothetical protein CCAX7_48800 [Capsulimonas corticalis]|uniref:Uncharacterized protein n=1 Tax=Capsulimonas corticalis TaxID=2219043 RepID=A0A402CQ02_9BACT|nr:hypothetical protein [Capsulimonas corticalis]BDI32829.1 hypothetical protein CCAX7_48800 [Capsulimonas corticalis]